MDDKLLPAEFDELLELVVAQPEHVRAMWRYALVLMMIDDEKARVVETHRDGETLHLIVQTVAGERFGILRPEMSEETEHLLLEQVRQIVEEETQSDQ